MDHKFKASCSRVLSGFPRCQNIIQCHQLWGKWGSFSYTSRPPPHNCPSTKVFINSTSSTIGLQAMLIRNPNATSSVLINQTSGSSVETTSNFESLEICILYGIPLPMTSSGMRWYIHMLFYEMSQCLLVCPLPFGRESKIVGTRNKSHFSLTIYHIAICNA